MCPRCGHEAHDQRTDPRCNVIAGATYSGGMPDPEYCGCVDADALYVALRTAEHRLNQFAVWAMRYALGRQTYAVADVTEALVRARPALTADTRVHIIEDIERALTEGRAGAAMDEAKWRDVLVAFRG